MATNPRSEWGLLSPFEPLAIYVHDRVGAIAGGRIRVHADAVRSGDALVSYGANDRRWKPHIRPMVFFRKRYEQIDNGRFSRICDSDERHELGEARLIATSLVIAFCAEGVIPSIVFQDRPSKPVARDAKPFRLPVLEMQPLDIAVAFGRIEDILDLPGGPGIHSLVRYTILAFLAGLVGYLKLPTRA